MRLLLRFWRKYASAFRLHYLFGIGFLVATNALAVAIPGFVQSAVDALTTGTQRGVDDASSWALCIIAAGLGIVIVRTLSRTLFFNPGRTIEFTMKNDLFDRLLILPRAFYDTMRPGEIISRGTNDSNWMRVLVGFGTLQLFNVVFTLIITLAQMLHADLVLTLACVGPLLLAALVLRKAVAAMFKSVQALNVEVANLSNQILESYNAISVLQSFGALSGARAHVGETNHRIQSLGQELNRIRSWSLPIVSVIGNLCVVIVLYVGGQRVQSGHLTIGQLAAFTVYVNLLVGAMTGLGWLVNAVQRGYLSLGRLYDVIDAPLAAPATHTTLPAPDPRGYGLQIRGLDFAYPTAGDKLTLRGLNLDLRPGETLGVFGQTGSGKSTLLQVLARVYDPPKGTVFLHGLDGLNGFDLRDLPVEAWRREVAYVPQEAFLFSTTLRENVALSVRKGEIDEERLRCAVDDAALTVDLTALPDGLETVVGERGITLSGGQRQRAALARAFYQDFRLLLLDDVMSAVDHATEKQLIDAVYRRSTAATTVIVSHRCSVVARAQRIVVFEGGSIVDEGRHEELLTREGPYARAYRLQMAAADLEGDAVEPV